MRLLFLAHRIPFPPNKGDKVRSYHLLRHLASKHELHLGSFIDDPDDEPHAGALLPWVKTQHLARLHPRAARLGSLRGLLSGEALSLPYYRDAGLARWVQDTVRHERIEGVVVFSSPMAQYALALDLPVWTDFVDMDSAKWRDYAPRHRWPLSWLYAREGRRLLAFERQVAAASQASYFVTEAEVALFAQAAPEAEPKLRAAGNGVESEFFAPDASRPSPFAAHEIPLVFTGAMDYWPNVDAVQWCVAEMLPALRRRWPQLRLTIVGRSPTAAVRALEGEGVTVTGTVPDVRPYLQHAAAVIAPLRLARGIQNKVLEAMAMAKPVVAADSCVKAIDAHVGSELISAHGADDYVQAIDALLAHPERATAIGAAARERVLASYSWAARLRVIDEDLDRFP